MALIPEAMMSDMGQQAFAELGITLPFSRAHAREAHLMGLTLMAEAGFRPGASVDLRRNMAAQAGGQPIEFLSTHPAHDTRIELLRANMDTAPGLYHQAEPAGCTPH